MLLKTLLTLQAALLAAETPQLFRDTAGKEPTAVLLDSQAHKLSDTPACRKSQCQAARALNRCVTQTTATPPLQNGGANPASVFCKKSGAKPTTFYTATKDAVAICQFRDQSWVDAWDLFRACTK